MIDDTIRQEELEHLYEGIEFHPKYRVLDALCGEGFASKQLIGRVQKIYGLDTKPRPQELPQEITYIQGSVERTSLDDEFFDIVLAHTGFHHVGNGNPQVQQQAVNQLYRVLKPQGKLKLSDLQGNTHASRVSDAYVQGHGNDCSWLTEDRAVSLLEEAGFEDIQVRSAAIRWKFENYFALDAGCKNVFGVDTMQLADYGMINETNLILPFVYASGVKA